MLRVITRTVVEATPSTTPQSCDSVGNLITMSVINYLFNCPAQSRLFNEKPRSKFQWISPLSIAWNCSCITFFLLPQNDYDFMSISIYHRFAEVQCTPANEKIITFITNYCHFTLEGGWRMLFYFMCSWHIINMFKFHVDGRSQMKNYNVNFQW